jgi:hypothetical protein
MSNDFKKVLLKDDRLMVTDSVNYAVLKGGQNVVCSTQPAISQSTSALTFNIQVPSEQTVVDRRVMWAQTTSLQFTHANVLVYGRDICLAPFPNHQLCSTLQATINNNSTSINIRDVLPALLKLEEGRELQRFSGTCPTASDVYYNYTDCQGQPNNQTGSFNLVTSEAVNPRGSFYGYNISTPGTSLPTGVRMSSTGSGPYVYTITYSTAEPLICPPFLYGAPISNTAGMYGIQNMNLVCNFVNGNRAIRFISALAQTSGSFTGTVSISAISSARLLLNYLTPHPSDLMPARNVVPYMEYPRYFSSPNTAITTLTSTTLTSNTYNLNQIPDKLIIFARPPSSTALTPSDADTFLTIQGISINFNNNSGILSSASMADLYRYSVEAGSNQSWNEFCGQTFEGLALANSVQTTASSAAVNGESSGTATPTATVGSVLCLDFGKHIQLIEDYYAPGSLGNFQVQFNLNVFNQASSNITPDLVLITVNSGVFVTERGQSSVYTGILTKQDVLDASQQEAYGQATIKRKVGGAHLDGGKALPRRILPMGGMMGMADKGLSSRLM